MSFANPFHEIFESRNYPHARTRRTTFWKKIRDTYFVFCGSFFQSRDSNSHVGIFDYCTLMIPHMFDRLTYKAWVSSDPIAIVFIIPLTLITLATLATRYVLGAIFTLLVFPLVLLAHGASLLANGAAFKQDVNTLPITINPKHDPSIREISTLEKHLKDKDLSVDDFIADYVGTYKQCTIQFRRALNGLSSLGCAGCCGDDEDHIDFSATLNLTKKEDKAKFNALLELNIGSLSRRLEERAHINFTKFNLPLDNLPNDENNVTINTHRMARP